jgi:hypothetical protein
MASSRGGCWDIIAVKGNEVLFVESKQHGNDQLNANLLAWMEDARHEGIPPSSFAIVEWSSPLNPAKAKRQT